MSPQAASTCADVTIRPAVLNDIRRLQALIEASVRGLQVRDYTPEQIDGALAKVFGVDTQLILDGTYFVAETSSGPILAGCGGWSKRATLCGGDHWTARHDRLLEPHSDAAKIRAFFVHPAWARRGIGSRILLTCEQAACAAGFRRFELAATLTGVALYAAFGYAAVERNDIALGNGVALPTVRMAKSLVPDSLVAIEAGAPECVGDRDEEHADKRSEQTDGRRQS